MITIGTWITENWELVIVLGVLMVLLYLTGTITKSARAAKEGLKEAMTPMGFVVLLAIAYIIYQIYLSVVETL